MRYPPFDYQTTGYAAIREEACKGHRRVVAVGPTAMGKTYVACMFMEACIAKGKKTIFVVHRREIVDQAARACREHNIPCGVIMGNSSMKDREAQAQICSVMTLTAKRKCPDCKGHPELVVACPTCNKTGRVLSRKLPEADLIILDEVHRGPSPSYMWLLEQYPKAIVLGLTATPARTDGKGLDEIFTSMVIIAEMQELIDKKRLLPLRYYAPHRPNLKGVKISRGDYDAKSLNDATSGDATRIGSIVDKWKELAEDRTTLFFGVSVEDSMNVASEFNKAGIPAAHVDANTPDMERSALFNQISNGEIKVLCNVDIATEGVDIPSLGCVILGRPTKSITVFLQAVGRAMRIFPGQEYAVVLDHAGCVYEHGLPSDPRQWSLHAPPKKRNTDAPVMMCPNCGAIRSITQLSCPSCGTKRDLEDGRGVVEVDGDLTLYQDDPNAERCDCGGIIMTSPLRQTRFQVQKKCRRCRVARYSPAPQAQVASDRERLYEWQRLEKVRIAKGFRLGWSETCYQKTFGVPPPPSFQTSPDGPEAPW